VSLPRTLVVDEHGEERTIVDHRFHDPRMQVEGDLVPSNIAEPDAFPRRIGFGRIQWWHVVAAFLVVVMLCVLSIVAYREHVKACGLRAAIAELTRAQSIPEAAERRSPGAPSPSAGLGPFVGSVEAPTESASPTKDRVAMERRGADLLAANDYMAALGHYRGLAAAFPGDRAFANIVIVLESKQRCLRPSPEMDGACH